MLLLTIILSCGPPKWSEFRLELSQSVQAVGSVVAPVLAAQVIFKNVGADGKSLAAVQYVYLAIAVFVAILAVVFYFAPLPEITDSDMADQAEMTTASTGYVDKPLRKQYTLFWGTFAQFCYVAGQVGVAAYFINYYEQARPDLERKAAQVKGANFYAIAQGLFAIGRFAAAGFMYIGGKPRMVLMAFHTLIMIFIAAAIGVNTGGLTRPNWGGVSLLMVVLFFESCIFPIIFALVSSITATSPITKSNNTPDSSWTRSPHQAWCLLPRLLSLRWCHRPCHPRIRLRPHWHQACYVHSLDLLCSLMVVPHLPQLHTQGCRARCLL